MRTTEARAALQRLGVERMICLDAEDGALRRMRLGGGASCAPSSRSCSRTSCTCRSISKSMPIIVPRARCCSMQSPGTSLQFQCIGYEVWTPLFPNCLVRIDSTMPRSRKQALQEYRSQLATMRLPARQYRPERASLGRACSTPAQGGYAEAFHVASLAGVSRAIRGFPRLR